MISIAIIFDIIFMYGIGLMILVYNLFGYETILNNLRDIFSSSMLLLSLKYFKLLGRYLRNILGILSNAMSLLTAWILIYLYYIAFVFKDRMCC